MTRTCPCCHTEHEGDEPFELVMYRAGLDPTQRRLASKIYRSMPTGLSARCLVDELYSNRSDGGPLSAEVVVKVQVHLARKKLQTIGWEIPIGQGGKRRSGEAHRYKIIKLERGDNAA